MALKTKLDAKQRRPFYGRSPQHEAESCTHLDQVVSGVAGAERPFKEHVDSVGFLLGLNQLVVLL